MTPKAAIAMLDRQIRAHGQRVSFRRGTSAQHDARGAVRGYKPDQIVGLVQQVDRQVILSPTTLGTYGVPKAGDDVVISGQRGKVQPDVEPIEIDDVLVRVNIRVRLAG